MNTLKWLGFPASADVGRLSRLIRPLMEQAQKHLGAKITEGVVTWSRVKALYEEDLLDGMEYVGLDRPGRRVYPWQHECRT